MDQNVKKMVSIIKQYSPKIRIQKPENTGCRCCVVGCKNRRGVDVVKKVKRSYHVFPKDQKRKELWIKAIPYKENWTPGRCDMVCSDHFEGGKPSRDSRMPNWIPSIFPPRPPPKQKAPPKEKPPPKPKPPPKQKRASRPRTTATAKRANDKTSVDAPKRRRKQQPQPEADLPAYDISDHDYVKQVPCPQLQTTMMAARMMRAVRVTKFGGPDVLKVMTDCPVPKPQDNQVLIKVAASGVNPADTYVRSGNYALLPTLPYTPGHDTAGHVEEVGPNVSKFKPGDAVYTVRTVSGGYAEYAVAEVANTFPLHSSLSVLQGAALGVPYFTAYRALFSRGHAKPGETVLIHGASGGVGLAACQMAHAHGLRVLGTAGSDAGLAVVSQNGAIATFNHTKDNYCDTIMDFTGGRGVDIVVEMLSNVNLEKDLKLLTKSGRVMVVGSRGRIEIDPRLTMGKETDIRGVMLWGATQEDFAEMSAALYAGQALGWLRPVIGSQYPLEQAEAAHTDIIKPHHATTGKMVLTL